MRMQAIDLESQSPLPKAQMELQVQGQDLGFLTVSTDEQGYFEIDDKFEGQQIALFYRGQRGAWMTATSGAKIGVSLQKVAVESPES